MTDTVRIAICVPVHGQVPFAFAKSLTDLYGFTTWAAASPKSEVNWELTVIGMGGSILPDVRTRLVAKAAEWGATHLLWVDSDMTFPPDALIRLYNHGKHVVGVNYVTKAVDSKPIAYVENDDEIGPLYTYPESSGLVSVKHTGMGLMLTTIAAFDQLDLPYFHFEPAGAQKVGFKGEDVWLCAKLRKAGIPVYVDQDLSKQIGHVGPWEYTHENANAAEKIRTEQYEGRWGDGGVSASAEKWRAENEASPEAAE